MPTATIASLFPTLVYKAGDAAPEKLNRQLERLILDFAEGDALGRRWCARHGYAGYTSYGSMHDLPERFPAFRRLKSMVERHAREFVKALQWDMRGTKPLVDSLWANVLPPGGSHTSHLHTNAVLSGTFYVKASGSGPLVFEDPRHAMMMAAPPRKESAPREMRTYVSEFPEPGTLLLWESWLRHEVAMNRGDEERISVSFNCVLR